MNRGQMSLDLGGSNRPRTKHFLWREVVGALVLAVMLVWAAWVTKELISRPASTVVRLNLAGLVQEYMVAASHSNWTADQIAKQTHVFTEAIDGLIAAYSRDGKVLLITEAVLSKNVPDITPQVRSAILKKVAWPVPGTAGIVSPLVPHGNDFPTGNGGTALSQGGADVRP